MDIEDRARLHALELLVTQLIAEHLRSVPEPAEQAMQAERQLRRAADQVPLETESLDEEARIRAKQRLHHPRARRGGETDQ